MGKSLIYGSVLIFSTLGAYIPAIWHANIFSVSGIIGGIIGTIFGIWVAVKVKDYLDL